MPTKKPKRPPAKPKKKNARSKLETRNSKLKVPAKVGGAALLATLKGRTLVQFTANGQMLLVARPDKKTITLFDLQSAEETPPLKALANLSAIALSADSRYLAMGTTKGVLAVESTQAGKVAWKSKPQTPPRPIGQVLFSLDGSLVITAAEFHEKNAAWIQVYQTATGQPVGGTSASPGFDPVPGALCCHLALSPDGLFLAHSEERSHSVLIWHLPTRQMSACIRLNPRDGRIVRLAFGHTVRQLYVAQENRITGWSGENGIGFVNMAAEGVRSLAVVSAGTALISLRSSVSSAALNVWGAETGHLRKTIPLPLGDYGHLAAPADGSLLALPAKKECWIWRVDKLVA